MYMKTYHQRFMRMMEIMWKVATDVSHSVLMATSLLVGHKESCLNDWCLEIRQFELHF